ncbi:hypothetical protein D3C83_174000 [compost metagenome]
MSRRANPLASDIEAKDVRRLDRMRLPAANSFYHLEELRRRPTKKERKLLVAKPRPRTPGRLSANTDQLRIQRAR